MPDVGVIVTAGGAGQLNVHPVIALHALLVRVQQVVFGALLAVNRIYAPHRLAKWQRATLARLTIAPDRLAEPLLAETVDLAEQATGLRLAEFRELLAERRDVTDPPAAGLLLLE